MTVTCGGGVRLIVRRSKEAWAGSGCAKGHWGPRSQDGTFASDPAPLSLGTSWPPS